MELRRDVVVGIGGVVLLAASISFAATALQERVVRSVSQIEAAHIQSVEIALEISRADLTEYSPSLQISLRKEARSLVPLASTKEETQDIEELLRTVDAWNAEDGSVPVTEAARAVARRNLADLEVQAAAMSRHAQGGVWILLLLATLGAMVVVLAWRWARRRIFEPVERIASVLEVAAERRTALRVNLAASPKELREIQWELEGLLDQRERVTTSEVGSSKIPLGKVAAAMLEQLEGEAVLEKSGSVVAANSDGMNALQGASGRKVKEVIATFSPDPLSASQQELQIANGGWAVMTIAGGFRLWRRTP